MPATVTQSNVKQFPVTITGQIGETVDVLISDSAATPHMVDDEGVIGSSKTLTLYMNLEGLAEGALTVTTTITNVAGNSSSSTTTVKKSTAAPPLAVTAPTVINSTNVSAFPISATGVASATVSYSFTDGTTTITGSGKFSASGTWSANVVLTTLKTGPVTLTVTETETGGNKAVFTEKLNDVVAKLATPTVTLAPASDSGLSSSDYITNVSKPEFIVATAAGTTATVYVNGTAYTGQKLADGSYLVTVTATDAYGNTATGSAPKTLVIATATPAGGFTVTGAKTIGAEQVIATATPTLALSYSASDGLGSIEVSTNGGASWEAVKVPASSVGVALGSGDGARTIEVRVTDVAGNTVTSTLTLRLDTTGPTISASLSSPQSAIGYDGTALIGMTISSSDLSGVASMTIMLDATTALTGSTINVYSLLAGTHTIVITAVDGVGNTSTQTITFQLHPSRKGIAAAVAAGEASKAITASEQTTLLADLNNSANSLTTDLNNFIAAVKLQSGKAVSAAEAKILIDWAQDDLKTLY